MFQGLLLISAYKFITAGCWEIDPHARPSFEVILSKLDEVSRSNFTQTPHDSFHTMQGHWKEEIEEKVNEIRMKENVSISCVGHIKEYL